MKKLRKFLRLNPSERQTLAGCLIVLPLTALVLRLTGFRRCQQIFSRFIPHNSAPETEQLGVALTQALRISYLVNLAATRGVFPANCLQRSLALWWLLCRQGIRSELRFGARKEAGRFEAHAWIEIAGVVLNDSADVRRRYATFDSATRESIAGSL